MPTDIQIQAIPADVLAGIRASGRDASGNPLQQMDDPEGLPLRCCLRTALPGEECILFGYEPPIPGSGSPYREIGAVFAHAQPCDGPSEEASALPWVGWPQALRAYDHRGWLHPATTTHDGTDPLGALRRVLSEPDVVEVHSRNLAYGCFMFAATLD
jgi:hypothetical protein